MTESKENNLLTSGPYDFPELMSHYENEASMILQVWPSRGPSCPHLCSGSTSAVLVSAADAEHARALRNKPLTTRSRTRTLAG